VPSTISQSQMRLSRPHALGGSGTCTEVVNGSFVLDYDDSTASDISFQLTGSLNASLDGLSPAPCVSPLCIMSDYSYDSGALASYDPIEFSPDFPTLNAPTPEALAGGADGYRSCIFRAYAGVTRQPVIPPDRFLPVPNLTSRPEHTHRSKCPRNPVHSFSS
jgi:hypothetical protein